MNDRNFPPHELIEKFNKNYKPNRTNIKPFKLNRIQIEAFEAFESETSVRDRRVIGKWAFFMPCGSGKTYWIAWLTKSMNLSGKILFIGITTENLNQAEMAFKRAQRLKDNEIGYFKGSKKRIGKRLTLASIQTLSRKKNLRRIRKNEFDIILVDECHHASAPTYKRVLKHFKPKQLFGFTGTPWRMDGKDPFKELGMYVFYDEDLLGGIEKGELVPFEYWGILDKTDWSKLKWHSYGFSPKDINKKVLVDERDDEIIRIFKEKIGDRKSLGFCSTIEHVYRLSGKFNLAGISSMGITYKTKPKERTEIINNFREGKYQILFSKDIFNESVDFPDVEGILIDRKTDSKRIFFQQIGRGSRKCPEINKKKYVIVDYIGNYHNAYKIPKLLEPFRKLGEKLKQKQVCEIHIPEVHFEPELIDLLELMKPISKQDLVIKLNKLIVNNMGQVPRMREFTIQERSAIQRYFKTYIDFLNIQGLKPTYLKLSNDEIIKDYIKLEKELGRQPLAKEFKWYINGNIEYRFKSWANFLSLLNRHPRGKIYTLSKLRSEYLRLKRIDLKYLNGKSLTLKRWRQLYKDGVSKINPEVFQTREGNYTSFLLEIRETPNLTPITIKELKRRYNTIKSEKGRIPYYDELKINTLSRDRMGIANMKEIIKLMGDKIPIKYKYSTEELEVEYKRVRNILQDKVSFSQMRKLGEINTSTYYRRWGSWKKAVNHFENIYSKKKKKADQ